MAMANAKTCSVLLLVLLSLMSAPLTSAVGPRHGRPNDDDFGGGQGGFFGMPWFGGGGGAPGGAGFFGDGGGAPGRGGFFGGGGGGGGGGGAGFGGWGAGGTWYRRGAVVPPSTVCAERGPCHGKRLTCPARCFKSYSYRSKNGGGGGGGGGCSFDCTKRCVASC
ncbi:hypothetical protein PR202_ga28474 [Eleusine coracana subsp. coracana]|uniref:Uncharacterized protein n=1 Tax=Eleusine coracana subsp. coracana TaxID=191504 RepID=A0AAV5DJQ1_ELECO|nr:hypothetical protein QOZ80_7AG0554360 [Eleusine coracana subsp. coracana]GJN10386.1 hypothetical protein PR202_ga28474 [Eleusine coracana subsp. coracana]